MNADLQVPGPPLPPDRRLRFGCQADAGVAETQRSHRIHVIQIRNPCAPPGNAQSRFFQFGTVGNARVKVQTIFRMHGASLVADYIFHHAIDHENKLLTGMLLEAELVVLPVYVDDIGCSAACGLR